MMRVMDAEERERLRTLLEGGHPFPGPFYFSVIATNDDRVTEALCAVMASLVDEGIPEAAWERRPSSGGRYVSHRVTVRCRSADHVLEIYAQVRAIAGVKAML
jgi:putative lipoic acid-binding regulatory protein